MLHGIYQVWIQWHSSSFCFSSVGGFCVLTWQGFVCCLFFSEKSLLKSGDLQWYFFTPVGKKYCTGGRMNRATEVGYWKTTGKDRSIEHRNQVVGMIRTLVFHTGKAPKGDRTDWVMHEYRLENKDLADNGVPQVRHLWMRNYVYQFVVNCFLGCTYGFLWAVHVMSSTVATIIAHCYSWKLVFDYRHISIPKITAFVGYDIIVEPCIFMLNSLCKWFMAVDTSCVLT